MSSRNRSHSRDSQWIVRGAVALTACLAAQQSLAFAQDGREQQEVSGPLTPITDWNLPGPIVIDGQEFASWAAFFDSEFFRNAGKRCATLTNDIDFDEGGLAGGSSADCSSTTTNPNGATIYAPAGTKFRIPVVFHVIRNAAGTQGNLSLAQVQANINVLNEDFLALAGTPGAAGVNGQIEFVLTNDHGTTPGTGIIYYNNDSWYSDTGTYYTNSKDVNNYLNIYSNSASGALGYVPYLGSSLGASAPADDRVVALWSAVGDPCPAGGVYCTGRTITHEVGHYLGLYHSFQSGCGTTSSPGCYTSADRICDTNATSTSGGNFGCPTTLNTCGDGVDNVRNYMDYTNDACMSNFTNEQVRRMRCVLDNRRIFLPFRIALFSGNFTTTPNTLNPNTNVTGTTVCDLADTQAGLTDGAGETGTLYAGFASAVPGDEVAYRINHTGGSLKVSLTGLTSDLHLFLLPAAGTPASSIARSTNAGSANEEVNVNLAAGTYYAIVDTAAVSAHSVYGSAYTIRYTRCSADITGDNTVGVADLLAVISAWGACGSPCPADITGDNSVGVADLLAIISTWGACA